MVNFIKMNDLIKEKGITKTFIASKLGKKSAIFSDWKNKKSKPSLQDIEIVANILGTTVEYLTDKTDIKNKPTANKDSELIKAEAELLELFRNVPEENQSLVLEMIEAALKNQGLLKQ